MEDEVKSVLVTIISLVLNSWEAKARGRHLWKAVKFLEQHLNKIQLESTNYDSSMELQKPKKL
jgi:hypothetical protein